MALQTILTRQITDLPLNIYLSVTNQAMSFVLLQEINKVERPVYFMSKVFKGIEVRY